MFEFIGDNYWEIAAVFAIIYMVIFMCVSRIFDGEYSSGIVITAIVVSTLTWPVSAPYFVIGTIVDNVFKGKKMPTETMEQYYERKWIETGDLNYLELANKLRSKNKDLSNE